MARKKTRKKTKRRSTRRNKSSIAMNWSALRSWGVPVIAGLSVLAIGTGMTFGVKRLDQGARELLASRTITVDLRTPADLGEPNWVRQQDLDELITRIHGLLDRTDPFDIHPLARVSEMLEKSGWFDDAPRIERIGQDTVRITGTWRKPAAVVRSGGRDHLISWDRMPMPISFAAGASGAKIIIGSGLSPADPDPQARYARPWPGDDVKAAIDLLKLLVHEPWYGQIAAIDVSGFSSSGSPIVLITDRESQIVWGGSANSFNPGEVSDEQKLARLRSFFERYGRIDGGFDRIEIQGAEVFRDKSDLDP